MNSNCGFDKRNTFCWRNFDGKDECAEELTQLYLLDDSLQAILGVIRFKYLGEQIIKGVKYFYVNAENIFDGNADIVLDSRLLFTSNIEAFAYLYRYDVVEPQAPKFDEVKELLCKGYPWW
jgi:hypothetical protein